MKIGYLGPPGSYSYEVALQYADELAGAAECIGLPDFSSIIEGVECGKLDTGIIPIENSTHGAVAPVMDMLVGLERSAICGEWVLTIEHCLLSLGNGDNIKYVYSHEQALEQCRGFFRRQYSHVELISCSSTTQACQLAKDNGDAYGAVASRAAGELYGLKVAAQNIQDNLFNQTRFLLLAVNRTEPTGRDKTSIVFAFHDDRPGSLFSVLKSFAESHINLSRIESRPAKHIMGKYIFYIDFCGHAEDNTSRAILKEISAQVSWLKVLGSYPASRGREENGR